MSKRILVVTTASVRREDLRDRVRAHAGAAAWLEEGAAEEALARLDLPVTHLVVAED